mmetsp:Transcript_32817/g.103798  ORF Transcript_32817/g.103798 Transcript_32817/m.103798 type:complete len:82 (+) Transcript_32817:96-341(+)
MYGARSSDLNRDVLHSSSCPDDLKRHDFTSAACRHPCGSNRSTFSHKLITCSTKAATRIVFLCGSHPSLNAVSLGDENILG